MMAKISTGGDINDPSQRSRILSSIACKRLLRTSVEGAGLDEINHIPRFVYRSETVAKNVLRIYDIAVVKILRKVSFWGVVAQNILHDFPDACASLDHSKMQTVPECPGVCEWFR